MWQYIDLDCMPSISRMAILSLGATNWVHVQIIKILLINNKASFDIEWTIIVSSSPARYLTSLLQLEVRREIFFSSQRQSMLVTSKHRGSFDNMHTCTCIQTWPSRRKQNNYPNSQILHIKLSKINFATGTKDSEF